MKVKQIHINEIEKEKYYKLGYEKGLKDNLEGMGYEEFKSVGFRYVFLNYTDELAVIVASGYAEGYGIDFNYLVVLYPDVEKAKKEISSTEQLKQGTLHAPYSPATYRTKDGNAFYKFRYVDIGGKFEIDIVEQPSYCHRDTSAHIIHRLPSARGGQKICISSGHEPKTLDGAKTISMQWAELTHTYILTGRNIDDQVSQNARPTTNTKKTGGLLEWLFG